MASYPNIAFDLCGICCGHFLMPFWTFFAATFIGKAIIRNGYQSFIYVMLCNEDHLERFIRLLEYITPDSLILDKTLRLAVEEGRDSFRSISKPTPDVSSKATRMTSGVIIAFWWKVFMASLLCLFFLSCISHFAQYYQLTVDQDDSRKLRKRLPTAVKLELTSPVSGRLKLPPPTPMEKPIPKSKNEELKEINKQKQRD